LSAVLDEKGTSLADLPATSLDELAASGALMTRTDRKYVVPWTAVPHLVARVAQLDPETRVLEVDGLRRHRYSSTYLDTAELTSYWMTARRRRRRFKVRSRSYVDSGLAFTEVKLRGARGQTVKTRTPVDLRDVSGRLQALPEAQLRFVHHELAHARLAEVDVTGLVPTLRTDYRRTTIWLPLRGARLTVDTGLTWSLPWESQQVRLSTLAVVETKTAGAATGVDRVLWHHGHRPTRFSKYGTGLSMLMLDLPAHRWHRIRSEIQPHLVDEPVTERTHHDLP
jgi:hypothetical protein